MSIGTIVTGLGRAIVSFGFGGGDEDSGVVASITLPSAVPLYTIALPRILVVLNIGDTALLSPIAVRNTKTGALIDPTTFTINVTTPIGAIFSLVWGTAPSSGGDDAVTRTAEGLFDVQIKITSARGVGLYQYDVTTTGAGAAEPGTFKVFPLRQ